MLSSVLPFPDESMATVNAMPPKLIAIFTLLVIPFAMISAGITYYFGKSWSCIVLSVSFGWLFVIHAWGLIQHMGRMSHIPMNILINDNLMLMLLGGMLFYLVLAFLAIFLSRSQELDTQQE